MKTKIAAMLLAAGLALVPTTALARPALPGVECGDSEVRLFNADRDESPYGWECHEIDTVTFYRDANGLMNWYVTADGPKGPLAD